MVTHKDRAQLLFVGAIALAFLIVGIAVVVNTTLFVENTQAGMAGSQTQSPVAIDNEVTNSLRTVTLRVNHRTLDHSATELGAYANNNVTRLGTALGESYAASSSLSVSVRYRNDSSKFGSRVVQAGDSTFENGSPNWTPVSSGSQRELGWFVVNLNASESQSGTFHANVTNETNSVNLTIDKVSDSNFSVRTSGPTGSASQFCTPRRGRLFLDLHRGQSVTDDSCRFNGTDELDTVSRVKFTNGDNAVGKYAIVTNSSSASFPECELTPRTDPCHAPVVWAANATVSVVGSDVQYESEKNVTIYPSGVE
ncbi:hypothetical protein G9463_23515 [Haloarcula sp. JP-Z28]|jgi:hypothetical protein|uniref:hypothetical protein n=1 Tax=Haloarcula sp. JP-Z28 TaxID=2716715 RepID=UPI0014054200|nr:hypothetical protein [Haloarcula sp. JP-Z28]NHN66172.1 hypothetical protein [Haloarcula sp. JP-Z28]